MLNPYITSIDTKVKKRKLVNNKTHLVPETNLVLDYDKLNIEFEDIYINDIKVEEIYNSSLGYVLVSDFKPKTSNIQIRIDFDKRIKILKLLTTRLLIKSILNKYFNIDKISFNKSLTNPKIYLNNIYLDSDARKIVYYLENNIKEYLFYGVEILNKKEDNITTIPGLSSYEYFEYTLSNLSELKDFNISKYEFNKSGLEVHFNIK